MAGINYPYRYPYETVAAGQTAQVLGGTGSVGDYLHRLIITVNTAVTADVTLLDGSTSIPILAGNPSDTLGLFTVEINAVSQSGAWKITTGAGVTVIAVGIFSP